MLAEIRAELAGSRRDLDRVERTLTDGYAEVLSLEAERLRLTRRLGSLVAALEGGDVTGKTQEVTLLAKEIERLDGALKLLRELLGELRSEYSRVVMTERAARQPSVG